MKCFESFSEGLVRKGISNVITCLDVRDVFNNIHKLGEKALNILSNLGIIEDSVVSSVAFESNEVIGNDYMLYKFSISLRGVKGYVSVRAVVRGGRIHSLIYVIGHGVPHRRLTKSTYTPVLTSAEVGSGGAPPGQRFIPDFIIYRILGQPSINLSEWRLRVGGLVKEVKEYTYDDLLSMERVVITSDFHCVTGWSVRGVSWKGIPIIRLVGKDNVLPNARWVYMRAADGYSSIAPLEDVLREDALLVLEMNGERLTPEQGFPARIIIPHLYGWKGVKWVTEIVLMSNYRDGYWEALGYHPRGNVWLEERFK